MATLAAIKPDIIISCLNHEISDDVNKISIIPPIGCQMIVAEVLLADADQLGRIRCMIAGTAA